VRTASGLDVPLRVEGAERLGAARLVLGFPAERFALGSVEVRASDWLAMGQVEGAELRVGLIGLGRAGPGMSRTLDVTVHLELNAGAQLGGDVRLTHGDFSGPDGAALAVTFVPATVPVSD